jgi:hypothetical protein
MWTIKTKVILVIIWGIGTVSKLFRKYLTSILGKHAINTRHKLKLHQPLARLKLYQKGVYYSIIKVYNRLLSAIAELVLNSQYF